MAEKMDYKEIYDSIKKQYKNTDGLEKMKNEIYQFIKINGQVSFIELEENISGFKGNCLFSGTNKTILWQGISALALDSLKLLILEDEIIAQKVSPLDYHIDGKILNYPIAKNASTNYQTIRWLPLVFNLPVKAKQVQKRMDESEINIIGQNGGDGAHYKELAFI